MMTLKMNMKINGWSMEYKEDSLILIQIRKADFLILTEELGLLILIIVRKEGTQILISIG